MNKKILVFSLAILVILAIIYIFATAKPKVPHVFDKSQADLAATSTPFIDEKTTVSEKLKYAEISYEMPRNNVIASDAIKADVDAFKKDIEIDRIQTEKDTAEAWMFRDMKYTYDATYELHDSKEYASYNFGIYTYTMGAHGNTYDLNVVLDKKNNKRITSLDQIYRKEVYSFLSKYARDDLSKQFDKSGVNDEYDLSKGDTFLSGTSESPDNFKQFYFKGESLVIIFGQYSIGPYAIGINQVEVPLNKIETYKK